MSTVSELAIAYLERYNAPSMERYTALIREACAIHPPPHGMAWYGQLYRQSARSAEWFANSLMVNAAEEGSGARQVWKFAQGVENLEFAQLVRNHAIDESRHSQMFVMLVNRLFPTQQEANWREQLKTLSPGYSPHRHKAIERAEVMIDEQVVMDEIIQINLLEIRALILQLLLRPVLQAYAQPSDRAKVTRMSDVFIYDETKHIEYSAYCIQRYVEAGNFEWVRDTMIHRQETINQMFFPDEGDLEDTLGTTILTTSTSS